MPRYIDADALQRRICGARCGCEYEDCGCEGDCTFEHFIFHAPAADVAPRADVIGEYRKRVYAKMEKYTVFGREYMQRIMREVEKEMTEG